MSEPYDADPLVDLLCHHHRHPADPMRCWCGHPYPDNGYRRGSWTMATGPAIHEAEVLRAAFAADTSLLT